MRPLAKLFLAGFACAACSGASTQVMMDFTRAGGFYDSPFPCASRIGSDGRVDLDHFPNPQSNGLAGQLIAAVNHVESGFGLSSAIYFRLTGPLRQSTLPDLHETVATDSPIFLLAIDPRAADYGRRRPILVSFLMRGGPYGADNLLALLPLQGLPLQPRETYAAVVLRSLRDAAGVHLGVSPGMADLAARRRPATMSDAALGAYQAALDRLEELGVARRDIAGLAVFSTGDPLQGMALARNSALAAPLPAIDGAFARTDTFPDYCVYRTSIAMPLYQRGTPPYRLVGGDWVFDGEGNLLAQSKQSARFFVTVPRRPMPSAGYPLVLFIRTGGGGDRPLVDRGVQPATGAPALTPGSGPALEFARVGFAGASIDGPHGGSRNLTGADEQQLVFNMLNPPAMRDNIRQSALELILAAHLLEAVRVDASDCPGATASELARFDLGHLVLMGHSMGATIAPLSLALEPRFTAAVLSGAGASWIENVMFKKSPLDVKALAEVLTGVAPSAELTEFDPLLNLLQWAGEPADPQLYAGRILRDPQGAPPRHLLMLQGIVDTYIPPPVANATSLALGLDLAGGSLDKSSARLSDFTPLERLLDLGGRRAIGLPAQGNWLGADGRAKTAIVVQHPGDGIEDGHEVVFQTEPPKRQYRCFLEGLLAGVPRVPDRDATSCQ